MKKKSKIEIKILESDYQIILFEDGSDKYREWVMPDNIFEDLIEWLENENKSGESDICIYNFEYSYVHIKRKDMYSRMGWTIPNCVLDYLVKNGGFI